MLRYFKVDLSEFLMSCENTALMNTYECSQMIFSIVVCIPGGITLSSFSFEKSAIVSPYITRYGIILASPRGIIQTISGLLSLHKLNR